MLRFNGVPVVPYNGDGLLRSLHGGFDHKGGPVWPDWSSQRTARFNRGGQPTDDLPEVHGKMQNVSGKQWAWIGPITQHFGHGITDYSTRIATTLSDMPDSTLVFSSETTRLVSGIADAPKWFAQMLDWYQVMPHRAYFVTRASLFDVMSVVAQAEQLPDLGPAAAYLDLLDTVTQGHFGTPDRAGVVYVSRAGLSGKFAGEMSFEAALAKSGVTIFRPETAPLVEQLKVYCHAERLIFAEGSALHGIQLLGRGLGDIEVICRRRGFRVAAAFIRPRARSLIYHDYIRGLVYGLTAAEKPAPAIGISILIIEKILEVLERSGLPIVKCRDSSAYDAEEQSDVIAWLLNEAGRPSTRLPSSQECIYRTLVGLGFSDLVPTAKALFGGR